MSGRVDYESRRRLLVAVPVAALAVGGLGILEWSCQPALEQDGLELGKVEQSRLIAANLEGHVWSVSALVPRIEAEIEVILDRHWGEGVSMGDFFHGHLRWPEEGVAPVDVVHFRPEVFHIQYHTKENLVLLKQLWIESLRKVEGSGISEWLRKVEANERNGSLGPYARKPAEKVELAEDLIERFSDAWCGRLKVHPEPGIEAFNVRDKIIILSRGPEEEYMRVLNRFLGKRSIVSSDRLLMEMGSEDLIRTSEGNLVYPLQAPRINVGGFWQPVQFYFGPLTGEAGTRLGEVFGGAGGSEAVPVLNAANALVMENLSASQFRRYMKISVELSEVIGQLDQGEAVDPHGVIVNRMEGDGVVAWVKGKKYLFALRYSLRGI